MKKKTKINTRLNDKDIRDAIHYLKTNDIFRESPEFHFSYEPKLSHKIKRVIINIIKKWKT